MVYSKTPKSRGFPEHRSPRLSQSQKRFLTTIPNKNAKRRRRWSTRNPKNPGFSWKKKEEKPNWKFKINQIGSSAKSESNWRGSFLTQKRSSRRANRRPHRKRSATFIDGRSIGIEDMRVLFLSRARVNGIRREGRQVGAVHRLPSSSSSLSLCRVTRLLGAWEKALDHVLVAPVFCYDYVAVAPGCEGQCQSDADGHETTGEGGEDEDVLKDRFFACAQIKRQRGLCPK